MVVMGTLTSRLQRVQAQTSGWFRSICSPDVDANLHRADRILASHPFRKKRGKDGAPRVFISDLELYFQSFCWSAITRVPLLSGSAIAGAAVPLIIAR
jgi:hypothetical protein